MPGHGADLGLRRPERVACAAVERRRLGLRTPARRSWSRRCAARRAATRSPAGSVLPSSSRSTSICSTVVMIIEPPGEPTASTGRPCRVMIVGAIELRGRLPPSARFGWSVESKLKSVSSLLSRKPAARHDDAVAARRLDRERVRDDEAAVVGDGEVRRRRALLGEPTRGRAARSRRPRPAALAAVLGDQRAPLGREAVRQQAAQRHVEVVRVGEVGVAVGERVARRLEEVVQRPRAVARRQRQALEDVQRLADGRAAARRRAHAPDVEALVADARRLAPDRVVVAPGRARSSGRAARRGWRRRRPAGCCAASRDRARERAAVEGARRRSGRSARRCARGPGCAACCRRRAACRRGRGRSPPSTGRR